MMAATNTTTVNNESLANLASSPNLIHHLLKFAKLYAAKLISMQFCQTLATSNFRHLQYLFQRLSLQ